MRVNVTHDWGKLKEVIAGRQEGLGPNEMLIDARLPHVAEQLDKKA